MESKASSSPLVDHEAGHPLSLLLLANFNKLFHLGSSRQLTMEDVGIINEAYRVEHVNKLFSVAWDKELALPKEQRSLWRALRAVTGVWTMLFALFLSAISIGSTFGPPLILRAISLHFAATQCEKFNITCGEKLSKGLLWLLISLLLVCPVLGSMLGARSFSIFAHVGCSIRSAIIPHAYAKSLVLSGKSKHDFSSGRVINLFSNDLTHLQQFFQGFAEPFFAPIQLAVALALIYDLVGVAMFTGLGVIVGVLPAMGATFAFFGIWRGQKMKIADNRIKLTNEIMNGIRIIKFYAWEAPFSNRIKTLRASEVQVLGKMNFMIVFIIFLIYVIPVCLPIIIFYTFIRLGNTLTPSIAFTVLAYLNLVTGPVNQIPQLIQRWVLAVNSGKRIQEFLECAELEKYVITSNDELEDKSVVVRFQNASFSWLSESDVEEKSAQEAAVLAVEKKQLEEAEKKKNKNKGKGSVVKAEKDEAAKDKQYYSLPVHEPHAGDEDLVDAADVAGIELVEAPALQIENPKELESARLSPTSAGLNRSIHTLRNINIDIKSGQLVAVIGPVGSGKSSFLAAMLGELILRNNEATEVQGKMYVCGSTAYHAQTPWIINSSVKENILFGQPYDEAKFQATIAAACLEADIAILPAGLDTEIGEKGINLSGGQKARVSFARAMYQNTDILLLDDPLSAVDAHVGEHLFHSGIKVALAGKTVILVTHQVHLLDECDKIIVLDAGQIRAQGTMVELKARGIDVNALMSAPVSGTPGGNSESRSRTRTSSGAADISPVNSSSVRATSGDDISRNRRRTASGESTPGKELSASGAGESTEAVIAALESEKPSTEPDIDGDDIEVDDLMSTQLEGEAVSPGKPTVAKPEAGHDLMTKEERVDGAVGLNIYGWYFKVGGYVPVIILIVTGLAAQGASSYSSFWLAEWGKQSSIREWQGNPYTDSENVRFFNIFALLMFMGIVGATVRGWLSVYHGLIASTYMHNTMLDAVVYAPTAFFDTTPLGRILNRFSSDVTQIDEGCAFQFGWVAGMIITVAGIMGTILYTTKGTFSILLVPLILMYYHVQRYFRMTNVELKRLESISRSPIYTEFSQALAGTTSLRAFRAESRFVKRMEHYVDENTTVWMLQQMIVWWLSLRLDILGGCVSIFCAILATAAPGFIPDNYLALSLQNAFSVTATLKWLVNIFAAFEAIMNNVERVHHYCHNLDTDEEYTSRNSHRNSSLSDIYANPPENLTPVQLDYWKYQQRSKYCQRVAQAKIEPPADWPSTGRVTGDNIAMSYRDGPLVLRGVDFDIASQEKIGIAGRTGCGKSSLMIALFRMERLTQGKIQIDGIDIDSVPLHTLRSKLGIIPQDPVLFASTVKFNLDPFSQKTDAEIWQVLESVNMKAAIESLPNALNEVVAEGGENFSAGERQLLCIARALLRHPKILVLDEATASVDNETDTIIQKTIRSHFKGCTILTIAHRLHTIIDSDRILVMDKGLAAEFDAPQKLISKEDSIFASLWKQHQLSRRKTKKATV